MRPLKKLCSSLASLAVEWSICFRCADLRRRQVSGAQRLYVSCTGAFLPKLPRKRAAAGFCESGCCDSQKRYRIYDRKLYAPNVHEVDDAGQFKVAWCFLPAGRLPAGDIMLAQKIALETNEDSALAVAKRFAPRPDLMATTRR